jgi:hypothetical protein
MRFDWSKRTGEEYIICKILILTVQHINSPKSSSKSHSVQHSSFQLIHDRIMNRKLLHLSIKGPLPPWLYGSWIYNAISAYHHWCFEFVSRSGRDVQYYVIKFVSDLDRSMVFSGSSGFLHQYNWLPRYNWNIVESGVNHHQTNKNKQIFIFKYVLDWFVAIYLSLKIFINETSTTWIRWIISRLQCLIQWKSWKVFFSFERKNTFFNLYYIYYKHKLIEWQILFIVPISIFYRNQAYILRWMRIRVHYRRKWHLLKLFETGQGRYGNVCFRHE